MIDRIIDEILTEMQRKITYEQLKDLEGVLVLYKKKGRKNGTEF